MFPWCIFPHPFTLRLHLVWSETEHFPVLRELCESLGPLLLWHCLPRLLHFYPFHIDLSICLRLKGTLKLLDLGSSSQNFTLQLLVTFVSQKSVACLLNLAIFHALLRTLPSSLVCSMLSVRKQAWLRNHLFCFLSRRDQNPSTHYLSVTENSCFIPQH